MNNECNGGTEVQYFLCCCRASMHKNVPFKNLLLPFLFIDQTPDFSLESNWIILFDRMFPFQSSNDGTGNEIEIDVAKAIVKISFEGTIQSRLGEIMKLENE